MRLEGGWKELHYSHLIETSELKMCTSARINAFNTYNRFRGMSCFRHEMETLSFLTVYRKFPLSIHWGASIIYELNQTNQSK
jgi:hypothetical protein